MQWKSGGRFYTRYMHWSLLIGMVEKIQKSVNRNLNKYLKNTSSTIFFRFTLYTWTKNDAQYLSIFSTNLHCIMLLHSINILPHSLLLICTFSQFSHNDIFSLEPEMHVNRKYQAMVDRICHRETLRPSGCCVRQAAVKEQSTTDKVF